MHTLNIYHRTTTYEPSLDSTKLILKNHCFQRRKKAINIIHIEMQSYINVIMQKCISFLLKSFTSLTLPRLYIHFKFLYRQAFLDDLKDIPKDSPFLARNISEVENMKTKRSLSDLTSVSHFHNCINR